MGDPSVGIENAESLVTFSLADSGYPTGVVQSVFRAWWTDAIGETSLASTEQLKGFVANCKALRCPEAGAVCYQAIREVRLEEARLRLVHGIRISKWHDALNMFRLTTCPLRFSPLC